MARKVVTSSWRRQSGIKPEHKKALVVGLNYKWKKDSDRHLETAERDALIVKRQLEKKGYKVKLLRTKEDERTQSEEATIENVCETLRQGVSIFHFSGHGAYREKRPEGERGALYRHCLERSSEAAKAAESFLVNIIT